MKVAVARPLRISGLSLPTMAAAEIWRSGPGRWRAAAGFAAATGHEHSRAARECSWLGLVSFRAEASWSSGSRRKGAEQVRRRRANFGHDPRLTACREVARTHQGLHGGHPGDHHAAPPVSCVSASSRTSPVNSFYLPVHTSCAEGMHMSPAARGVNIGTRMKVPGHTAHSAARILHFDTDPLWSG